MNFNQIHSMYQCGEMLAAFFKGLVDNGMDEDIALDLTMVVLENTLNGAVKG